MKYKYFGENFYLIIKKIKSLNSIVKNAKQTWESSSSKNIFEIVR